MYNKGDIQM